MAASAPFAARSFLTWARWAAGSGRIAPMYRPWTRIAARRLALIGPRPPEGVAFPRRCAEGGVLASDTTPPPIRLGAGGAAGAWGRRLPATLRRGGLSRFGHDRASDQRERR